MKHYDFIEIGTSDFDTLIESSDDNMVGLSIEPIKYYLDRLPNKKNVKKIQLAVSDVDGDIDIYYIPDEKIKEHVYSIPRRKGQMIFREFLNLLNLAVRIKYKYLYIIYCAFPSTDTRFRG